MKKRTSIFLLLCVLLLASAAHSRVLAFTTPLPIGAMQMEQERLMTAEIPQITGGMNSALLSRNNESLRQVVFDRFRQFEETALDTKAMPTLPDAIKNHIVFKAGFKVLRNDGRILSLTQNIYQYTGGAHGLYWNFGYNMDVLTGATLKLPDVFIPGSDWTERMNRKIRSDNGLFLSQFKGVGSHSNFYFDEKGLTVYFQIYEIAAYVAGIIRFDFSYEELRDVLRPEYVF